ncbi:lipoate--protein ligase family protein [Alkalibacillus flavidus]
MDRSDAATTDILTSFAIDDTLCLSASDTQQNALHMWVHKPAVVLGIPDKRMPYIEQGIELLTQFEYDVIIRNSGGLAVLLDEGVLNLSLIFPEEKQFNIHDSYDAMVAFIRWLFEDESNQIDVYEITQSYCPGSYDLSINGQKFAGISQRRVKQGTAVQIYLCVEGDGQHRAEIIRQFYDQSLQGEATSFDYPDINPNVMASLEQLLGKPLKTNDVKDQLINKLNAQGIQIVEQSFNTQEKAWFDQRETLMHKRNRDITS